MYMSSSLSQMPTRRWPVLRIGGKLGLECLPFLEAQFRTVPMQTPSLAAACLRLRSLRGAGAIWWRSGLLCSAALSETSSSAGGVSRSSIGVGFLPEFDFMNSSKNSCVKRPTNFLGSARPPRRQTHGTSPCESRLLGYRTVCSQSSPGGSVYCTRSGAQFVTRHGRNMPRGVRP